jgi:predicted DNA-binding transcriptional regulator AlpA
MNYEHRRQAALDAAQRQAIHRKTAYEQRGWVTMAEACIIMRCGKTKLYQHLKERPEGFPRIHRYGGTNLMARDDIDAWMNSRPW